MSDPIEEALGRLGCIAWRELDDRTLTPGQAADLLEALAALRGERDALDEDLRRTTAAYIDTIAKAEASVVSLKEALRQIEREKHELWLTYVKTDRRRIIAETKLAETSL
jgi:hypothetical protein